MHMKKDFISETLFEMSVEEFEDADLKTMLEVIGSYLYAGAEIEEVDDGTYDRLLTLIIKHINREVNESPVNSTIQ